MKALVTLLVTLPSAAPCTPPAFLPEFRDRLPGLPNMSLSGNVGPGLPPIAGPLSPAVRVPPGRPAAPRRPQYVSRMPVLEPDASVDPHMPIKVPDPRVDYKLSVQEPAVGPAR